MRRGDEALNAMNPGASERRASLRGVVVHSKDILSQAERLADRPCLERTPTGEMRRIPIRDLADVAGCAGLEMREQRR